MTSSYSIYLDYDLLTSPTMKSDEIQSLFATKFETYAPIEGQPLDPDISTLQETLTALLLLIAYDGEKVIQNLVGLIMDED